MKDLGPDPAHGTFSEARGINVLGQVTGYLLTTSFATRAFRWTASGGMQDLGTLAGGTFSVGTGINALGQVTGNADTTGAASHAFRWTP